MARAKEAPKGRDDMRGGSGRQQHPTRQRRAPIALVAGGAALALALLSLTSWQGMGALGSAGGGSARPINEEPEIHAAPLAAAVSIDLCAKTGSVTMPGAVNVPIWGFALGTCGAAGPATLPGPTLDVTAGDVVTINLHNSLAQSVSLNLSGQELIPDTTGAAPAGSTSYTFTASDPGTYLYEAGLNAQIQVPMGLFGPLIVRPLVVGQAYDGADSTFDKEALLVLSEIDPALNANPNAFDMLDYAPKYWLINGKVYPNTAPISADPGDRVLLRYANAGVETHSLQAVGFHQLVYATDAQPQNAPHQAVSLTVAPGQTADTFLDAPAANPGSRFPVYSANMNVTNVNTGPGGMLTFLTINGILGMADDCVSAATMNDALLVAQVVVGLEPDIPCPGNADVNHDGQVTMSDALQIARFVVGLDQ